MHASLITRLPALISMVCGRLHCAGSRGGQLRTVADLRAAERCSRLARWLPETAGQNANRVVVSLQGSDHTRPMKRFRQLVFLCIALSLPSVGVTAVAQRTHCDFMAVAAMAETHHMDAGQSGHDQKQQQGSPVAGHAMSCSTLHCAVSGCGAAILPADSGLTFSSATELLTCAEPSLPHATPALQDPLRPPIHG